MKKIFLFIITISLFSCTSNKQESVETQLTEATINIPTVVCEMCEETIKKAAFGLEGVKSVEVNLEKKNALVKFASRQTNIETIEMAITDAGYDANSRKRNPDAYASLPDCCKKE